ncbi:MAG: sigma-70 family RNA polymerase sigma factor [Deltaproteobacteria bacterium]|nr:sigma-70 family RNA polymerase sigma factor [Deltaproteobacteria bacterium]
MSIIVFNLPDTVLIQRIRKGCECSFQELVQRYETKVHNLAIRLTRNQEDAEEVIQDVFITVYRKIKSFEGKAKFSSWLYRVTVNAAFMKLRKNKQEQAVSLEDCEIASYHEFAEESENATSCLSESEVINKEMRSILELAISKLPDEYKNVFVLRDIDGLSNKEVGRILNISVSAVKSRLHRSRLMLRKKLRRFYDGLSVDTNSGESSVKTLQKAA